MIRLENVHYRYAGEEERNSLHHIDLEIAQGETVVLCGESGCGKTTLTRIINGLIPHFYEGELTGTVTVMDSDPSKCTIQEMAGVVGSVFQNPRSQFFSTNTTSELAFGSENMGIEKERILSGIQEVDEQLHFSHLLDRDIFKLSGGEKQKIACGSVSVTDNAVYVLDEPSSNLDLKAIENLKEQIKYWKRKGKTIIIAEHRLYYLWEIADRMIYMKEGKIIREFSKQDLLTLPADYLNQLGLRSLSLEKIYPENQLAQQWDRPGETLDLENFSFAYKRAEQPALDIERLSVPKGSITAIVGFNGAGKSTFARCVCGLEKRCKGKLTVNGVANDSKARLKKSYMVMQDVNYQLFTESVLDEILLSMAEKEDAKGSEFLEQLDIAAFAERHPLSLSGGQKQRVAIASALASESEWIFFDEPTSGLDYRHMVEVAQCLIRLSQLGKTIFVISHDFELIAKCCNFFLHLDKGTVVRHGGVDQTTIDELRQLFV